VRTDTAHDSRLRHPKLSQPPETRTAGRVGKWFAILVYKPRVSDPRESEQIAVR